MFIRSNPFRFDPALPQFFFATDDNPGGNSGTGEDDKPQLKPKKDVNLAVESAFVDLLAEHGSPEAVSKHLIKRNHSLQTAKDKAETNLTTATANAMSDADKAELAVYREKGKPEDFDTFKERAEKAVLLEREKENAKAMKILGVNAEDPLYADTLGKLLFEVEGEGDEVKVKVRDGEKVVLFDDYAKDKPNLTRALEVMTVAPDEKAPITKWGKGAPIGGGKKTESWDRIRAAKKEAREEGSKAATSWQEQVGVRP